MGISTEALDKRLAKIEQQQSQILMRLKRLEKTLEQQATEVTQADELLGVAVPSINYLAFIVRELAAAADQSQLLARAGAKYKLALESEVPDEAEAEGPQDETLHVQAMRETWERGDLLI